MTVAWENRLVATEEVDPSQLLASPENCKIHPARRQRAVTGSLDELGWLPPVLVNRRTGHVVDGHLRVMLAIRRAQPTVPVADVDLSDDEERLALPTLETTTALAATDDRLLADLLAGTRAGHADLQALLDGLAAGDGERPFAPTLNPTASHAPVPAADALSGRFDRTRSREEVTCPHCAGRFLRDR